MDLINYDGYTIIQAKDFISPTYELLGSTRKRERVFDCISILDIETSWNHNLDNPDCWIYQWAWLLNDIIVIGRTKEEIIETQRRLTETNTSGVFHTYIHNLSYEFSYLWYDWEMNFGFEGQIMASAPRKPFKCKVGNMCFICSYKMSNRSLSSWGDYYNVKHKKLDNGIDYNAIHFPTSKLSREDWLYMLHDVICPKECILTLMNSENMRYDQLFPTSTMYVKNEVTKEYMQDRAYFQYFSKCQLNTQAYNVLRQAFVGGITHANWKYLGKTVRGKIRHYDFDSHYPTQMITKKFPVGKVYKIYNETDRDIHDFVSNDKYAYFIECDFENLRLRSSDITMPYLSVSKCHGFRDGIKDNGRLVSCNGYCKLYFTSLDLDYILKQYICDDYQIKAVFRSRLEALPVYIRSTINKFYTIKSTLKKTLKDMEDKGLKDTEEYMNLEVDYAKSKNVLNGLYGVTATDPIRDDFIFADGNWSKTDIHAEEERKKEILDKHYKSRGHWTRYEFGVYVTAWARHELMECIELVGYDNFLYCDTDSIFFLESEDNMKAIEELNRKWYNESVENGYGVKVEESMKYMHKFDAEQPLRAFRSLGAKCYAMEELNKKTGKYELECVIAGVPKAKTYIENGKPITYTRNAELKDIDNLKQGYMFNKCVPIRAIYTHNGCILVNSEHMISLCDSEAEEYFDKIYTGGELYV